MQCSEAHMNVLPRENEARRKIVVGARRHFYAHGFRGVTMDEIAKELGMSKKTLYVHFPSKMALLEAAIHNKFQDVEADLLQIGRAYASDFPGRLQQLLACMQHHTAEVQPPFIRDMRLESPELFEIVESRRRDLIHRYFGKLLNDGRRAGIIRRDIPVKLVTGILLGAVQAVVNPAKMEELNITPKEGLSAILTVILEGLITEKGRSKL